MPLSPRPPRSRPSRPSGLSRALVVCLVASAVAVVGIGATPQAARAEPSQTPDRTWVTNGRVSSIVHGNGRIYLGGYFTQVAPNTGQGMVVDSVNGTWNQPFPYVDGWVMFRATGKPVPINAMIGYYRSFDHQKTGVAEPFPADMRLVAGDPRATAPQSVKRVNWSCNQNSSRRGPYTDAVAANCAAATGTVHLTAHIDFPSCWDGKMNDHSVTGNTADYSDAGGVVNHLAFASGSQCPTGFPRKLPELRMTINWKYQGNGKDIILSSDRPTDPAGRTLHGDFWNTWVQTGGTNGGMVEMVKKCVNTLTGSKTMCG